MTLTEQVLFDLADHWQLVSSTWSPDPEMFEDYEDSYHHEPQERGWSCFFVGDLLQDMLGHPRENRHPHRSVSCQILRDPEQIDSILAMPNTGHTFSCMDHMFTIISYRGEDGSQVLYYCDYWMEARETNCFRIEEITVRRARKLLVAYLAGDLETFARFSSNDLAFVNEYDREYRRICEELLHDIAELCTRMECRSWPIADTDWQTARTQLDSWIAD